MSNFVLKESQFNLIKEKISSQDNLRITEEKWEVFSDSEKEMVLELLNAIYPEKSKLIKESWLNTLGDIVGIFDPTGVVDLVNGVSYISQGEYLFGFLSIISAIPYAGDIVAKPMMGALKLGKPSAKALNGILKTAKAGDTVKASAELAKLAQVGGITGTFIKGVEKIAPKLRSVIERMPGGFLTGGLKRTILQWIDLFGSAGKRAMQTKQAVGFLAKKLPKLAPEAAAKELAALNKAIKNSPGVFSGYRTSKGVLSWKTIFGGMPQLMGRNKSVRSLMRQSKWWLGFLDYIGLGNWVGPEEVSKKLGGEENLRSKMEEYNKTSQAQKNFEDQFGGQEIDFSEKQNKSNSTEIGTNRDSDPFAKIFRNIFTGLINPLPG
jgi:hypothetical protein